MKANRFLQFLFFSFIVRPIMLITVGLNVRGKEKLPDTGPAILVANHNSHLDTMALMSLYSPERLHKVRPVAAQDYFFSNPFLKWLSTKVIGIVAIDRAGRASFRDPLAPCHEALGRGEILIIFPEGTRGEPEKLVRFKKGISHLALRHPTVPVTPVFMHGLGKVMPRGDWVPVPFFCDVFVGDTLPPPTDRHAFMQTLENTFQDLSLNCGDAPWD